MMNRRANLSAALLAVVLVAKSAASLAASKTEGVVDMSRRYTTWQAPGYVGLGIGPRNIHWVDDNTVLFLGRSGQDYDKESNTIRLWNVSAGAVSSLGPGAGEICYFRGYLTYWERADEELVIRTGSINETKATVYPRRGYVAEMRERGLERHLFNCQEYEIKAVGGDPYCRISLLHGDGVLDVRGEECSPATRARERHIRESVRSIDERGRAIAQLEREVARSPARYFPHGSNVPIVLPIESGEMHRFGAGFAYSEWAKAYILPPFVAKGHYDGVLGDWPVDIYPIYVLRPGGAVEVIQLPLKSYFRRRPPRVFLTRSGIAVMNPGETSDGRRRYEGLVMFTESGVEQLGHGYTQQMAVSPNGCRIAFEERHLIGPKRTLTVYLKAIDVCLRKP
jgi:hypothetical protein